MKTHTISIIRPSNLHGHLRYNKFEMLKRVVFAALKHWYKYLVMPNATDDQGRFIYTAADMVRYHRTIVEAILESGANMVELLMTIYLNELTTPDMILDAKLAGAFAAKGYPRDGTTGAEEGILDYRSPAMQRNFAAMQELGMPLLLHGELPGAYYHDAEELFLPELQWIHKRFPRLVIKMEHLSTAEAVKVVMDLPEHIGATITPQHLLLTGNDVYRGKVKVHNHCMPTIKRASDREALLQAILNDNPEHPKLMCGGDSAPHLQTLKECAEGCAGCFNDPVSIPLYWQAISGAGGDRDTFERFMSLNAARFHKFQVNEDDKIILVNEDWTVPPEINGIVPFFAGKTINWQVLDEHSEA